MNSETEDSAGSIVRKNFRCQLLDGILYASTGSLIAPQTIFSALVQRLGGGNIAVGAIPLFTYIPHFLIQLFSANHFRNTPYKKDITLRISFFQRAQILALAVVIALWGGHSPTTALYLFFFIYFLNQVIGGTVSPLWFDLFVKLTDPFQRGKLIGLRNAIGSALGFVNGLILTVVFINVDFPYNFAIVFGLAGCYQYASWFALKRVIEDKPSEVAEPVPIKKLWSQSRKILDNDSTFKRFLISISLAIVGTIPMSFFTVAALDRFKLDTSVVGTFSVIVIVGQVISSAFLGYLSDRRGNKIVLLLCSTSLVIGTICAIIGTSLIFYYIAFFCSGITLGAELIMRYNFAADCSTDQTRSMYVALMNLWSAPFYLSGLLGGYIADLFGYNGIFFIGIGFTIAGMIVLYRLTDPRKRVRAAACT
jgi:MFS family permease